MAWSTSQLADLTGVTLRSIRHWHDIGLLPQPERLTNGYKQYTARHLVLALRIARLTSLGFTLEQVGDTLDSEERGQESLRALRIELEDRIRELTRMRTQVDELIGLGISPDLSPEALLATQALGSDPGSRNVAIMLAHLIPGERMPAVAKALREAPAELGRIDAELRGLHPESSDDEVTSLAERTIVIIDDFLAGAEETLPVLTGLDDQTSTEAMTDLVTEHMNPAQRRVMALVIGRFAETHG